MICPNCNAKDTAITNSRSSANSTQTWRRHTCKSCNNAFTSYERYDLKQLKILQTEGHSDPYNRFGLAFSLLHYLGTATTAYQLEALVDTIEAKLIAAQPKPIDQDVYNQIIAESLKPVSYPAYVRMMADLATAKNDREFIRQLKQNWEPMALSY